IRCQSVAKPFTAEYWCIGATTTRFFKVTSRMEIGSNSSGPDMRKLPRGELRHPPSACEGTVRNGMKSCASYGFRTPHKRQAQSCPRLSGLDHGVYQLRSGGGACRS